MSESVVVEGNGSWVPWLDEPPIWEWPDGSGADLDAVPSTDAPSMDAVAAWAATADFGSSLLTPFGALDPDALSDTGRVDALVAAERLQAWAAAQSVRLLAAMTVPTMPSPSVDVAALDKQWVREEIGCALRQHPALVNDRITVARELLDRLPATLALLETGAITARHAAVLAEATAPLDDPVATRVEHRVLPRAPQQSVPAFRAAVRRAVHACDPRTAEDRYKEALTERRVIGREVGDGMGELWARLSLDELAKVMTRIEHTARQLPADPTDPHSLDQRRADALLDLITATSPGAGTGAGTGPAIQVTLAASTLLGLDDHPADIDGYGTIPATLARAIAVDPTARLHRLLTDPATGRLLDYGRATYRPPADLADYIKARDRTCRFPGCTRRAHRCDIDHRHPWTAGGVTAPHNCEALCLRHHHLKHEAGWQVRGNPENVLTWISPTGHRYTSTPPGYDQPEPTAEPPPF